MWSHFFEDFSICLPIQFQIIYPYSNMELYIVSTTFRPNISNMQLAKQLAHMSSLHG